ncbi:MAG: tRNA (cytosine(32)/uridine(32)-2'-O)-methyltransferase TrmJ [Gammaproteobacteria bacterium]
MISDKAMLHRIRIILVNTSHPGNIGSAARAMKTMGLSTLYLLNPKIFPSELATALAAGSEDILEEAQVVSTLDEALAGCSLILGTSARERSIRWPLLTPRESSQRMINHLRQQEGEVALLFGEERIGLTNASLQRCHYHVTIPANPNYSSLNLASSVQVLAYECRQAWLMLEEEKQSIEVADDPLPPAEEMERLFQEIETVLLQMRFLNPKAPRQLLPRLHRFFLRSQIETMEMAIFRGIFAGMKKILDAQESKT